MAKKTKPEQPTTLDLLKSLDIGKIVDEEVTREYFRGDCNPYDHVRPSSASIEIKGKYTNWIVGSCNRAIYYHMTKAPVTNPPTAYLMKTAIWGQMVEETIVRSLRARGLVVAPSLFGDRQAEMWLPDLDISGHLDAVLRLPDDPSKLILLEVKSFHGYYAMQQLVSGKNKLVDKGLDSKGKKITEKYYIFPEPKSNHLIQATTYLHAFKDKFIGGKLHYQSRDNPAKVNSFNLELVEKGDDYSVKINGREQSWVSINAIHSRFKAVKDAYASKIIPPRDYKLYYNKEDIDLLWKESEDSFGGPGSYLIGKTDYEDAQKQFEKKPDCLVSIGWMCSGCQYRDLCYKDETV